VIKVGDLVTSTFANGVVFPGQSLPHQSHGPWVVSSVYSGVFEDSDRVIEVLVTNPTRKFKLMESSLKKLNA
jgi:hypothetical protein